MKARRMSEINVDQLGNELPSTLGFYRGNSNRTGNTEKIVHER